VGPRAGLDAAEERKNIVLPGIATGPSNPYPAAFYLRLKAGYT
jgi:hypothetical protein